MCVNLNDPVFYVYVYLDPCKPGKYVYGEYEFDYEPFYVGKGNGKRAYDNHKENIELFNKINEIRESIIFFHKEKMKEYAAFRLECKIIKAIGRQNIGTGPLYNLMDECGGGMTGHKHTEETKKKMRNAWKNRQPISEKTRERMSVANKGKIVSEKTRIKIRNIHKGKVVSTETREKMRLSHLGKTLSEETKMKISISEKGKIVSDETKEKMKGRNISDETRQKRSESAKGKKHSEETKQKISESKRLFYSKGK